jgi:hypothetical protein
MKTNFYLKLICSIVGLGCILSLVLVWAMIFIRFQLEGGSLLICEYNPYIRGIEIFIIGYVIIYVLYLIYSCLQNLSSEFVEAHKREVV